MQSDNLTLKGKSPDPRTLEYIVSFSSREKVCEAVAKLFTPNGDARYIFKLGFYDWRIDSMFGDQGLIDCLKGLSANHVVVQEILNKSNLILKEVPELSLLELKTKDIETPIICAFDIGDIISPEIIYPNLSQAAYHILKGSTLQPELSHHSKLVGSSVRGMFSYNKTHKEESLEFANFLRDKNITGAYMLRLYAELGSEEAIIHFAEALRQDRKGIDFKYLSRGIKKTLIEGFGFPLERFIEYSHTIKDAEVRNRFREYFEISC